MGRNSGWTAIRRIALGVAAAAAVGSGALAAPSADGGVVATASGPVTGVPRAGMVSYFAIPYAAPPIGDLRWRPPQPPAAWTAPMAKTQPGSPCIQTGVASFRAAADSEDCLYLDVHKPLGAGPFPVMVWIHGGAFTSGSSTTYADPSPLVSRGVIVVAMNYRLGALGFMAHPALRDADGAAGDYGIMDQQAALAWVRANIKAFGGDPSNVTLFGESAGGFSVLTHLASPRSAGLFQKAVIESGAYGVSGQLTQAQLEAKSAAALKTALSAEGGPPPGCAPEAVTAACLRGLPEAVIRKSLMKAFAGAVENIVPSVDGKVLPQTIKATFAAGKNNRVPVLGGSNKDENMLFVALAELGARFSAKPPSLDPANRAFLMTAAAYEKGAVSLGGDAAPPVEDLKKTYYPLSAYGSDPALQPSLASGAAGTDAFFACNGVNVAARVVKQGEPFWMYEFRDVDAPPLVGSFNGRYVLSTPQGAAHASELSYLFNMLNVGGEDQKALKAAMATYWTNFARSGDPNGPGAPAWKPFSQGVVQALDISARGGVKPMTAAAFKAEHKCSTAWARETF